MRESEGTITTVRYDWNVRTTGIGMTLLAALLKPLLAWNHDEIMRWGEAGLTERLKAGDDCESPENEG